MTVFLIGSVSCFNLVVLYLYSILVCFNNFFVVIGLFVCLYFSLVFPFSSFTVLSQGKIVDYFLMILFCVCVFFFCFVLFCFFLLVADIVSVSFLLMQFFHHLTGDGQL